MSIVKQKKLILADVVNNNNKFWNIELRDDGTVVSHFGRVGYGEQTNELGNGEKLFDSKIREKLKKGYKELQLVDIEQNVQNVVPKDSLSHIAKSQIQITNPLVEQLVERLSSRNVHNILGSTTLKYNEQTGLFTTPLGIVNQSAIDNARTFLVNLQNSLQSRQIDTREADKEFSEYLMLVPKNIGMKAQRAKDYFTNSDVFSKENDILESLEASLKTAKNSVVTLDNQKIFDVQLNLLKDAKKEKEIEDKYYSTRQTKHQSYKFKIKTIYEIQIGFMKEQFKKGLEEEFRFVSNQNVWKLWHGTKIANVLSILHSGLKISPPSTASIAGKMFGNGIYFSDISSKALNYAAGYWDGKSEKECFMFLADVAMGNYYTPSSYNDRNNLPRSNYHSTFAKAGVSGVINNEMIVYKEHQYNLCYLVEFSE